MNHCADCGQKLAKIDYLRPLTRAAAAECEAESRRHNGLEPVGAPRDPLCRACWERALEAMTTPTPNPDIEATLNAIVFDLQLPDRNGAYAKVGAHLGALVTAVKHQQRIALRSMFLRATGHAMPDGDLVLFLEGWIATAAILRRGSLEAANATLMRMLESLTPGGPEFADNPQNCIRWMLQRRAITNNENVRLMRERNQAVDEVGTMKAKNARLRQALEAARAALAQESNSQKREHAQDERDGVST